MRAWEEFLTQQERELGIETVNHWLRSLKVLRFDACNLWLQAKDSFQSLWFEEHLRKKVETTLRNQNNHSIKVHLTVNKKTSNVKSKYLSTNVSQNFTLNFDEIDSYCTFDNFIQSPTNQLPFHILTQACAMTSPDVNPPPLVPQFNPIYIYGGRGSGKTHLLKATAHAFRQQGLKGIYVRAETFTEHVVNAIKAGEMSEFRNTYRNSDALLIDDIQVLANKGATQEELFHTFNALHLINKLIVISAPCSPQLLHSIEPRLISRFEWGIALSLSTLSEAEWPKILQMKAKALDFSLDSKVSQFIADTFSSHPKACVAALEALILRLHLQQQQLKTKKGSVGKTAIPEVCTVSLAEHILADLIRKEEENALTPSKIIQIIADQFEIQTDDILGKAQTRDCALPRQMAMYFCRIKLKLSFKEIGRIFGRDHSTVMTSVKQIQEGMENGVSDVVFKLTAITQKLQE